MVNTEEQNGDTDLETGRQSSQNEIKLDRIDSYRNIELQPS